MRRIFGTLLTVAMLWALLPVFIVASGQAAACEGKNHESLKDHEPFMIPWEINACRTNAEPHSEADGNLGKIIERCEIIFATEEEILFRESETGIVRRVRCTPETSIYRNGVRSTYRSILPIEDSRLGILFQEATIELDGKLQAISVRCHHTYEEIGVAYADDTDVNAIGIIRGVAGRIRLIIKLY